MGEARDQLLARVMAHVAETGLSDVSLRELADAVGTSHRMLHYHFGGRDGLVAAIVEAMEAQQREALRTLAEGADSPTAVVQAQWAELSRPEVAPFVRLFFEVLALALHGRPGTEGFLDDLTQPWIDVGAEVAERIGADLGPADVRLGIAVMRGLLVDALASGDVEGTTASLERFVAMWEAAREAEGA